MRSAVKSLPRICFPTMLLKDFESIFSFDVRGRRGEREMGREPVR